MILKFIKQSAFQHTFNYKFSSAAAAIDYYSLLGVQKGATTQQIAQAFKKISSKISPETNSSLFNRVTEAFVILSDGKARDAYDSLAKARKFSYINEPTTKPITPSYIAQRRAQKAKQISKKLNIDKYGRYRGGVPRNNTENRGNALGEIGSMYHETEALDTFRYPEYSSVDAAKAQSFKNFHQSQRQNRTAKRPWFSVQVDYDYFHPKRLLDKLTFLKWIVFVTFILPGLIQAKIEYSKRAEKRNSDQKKKQHAEKEKQRLEKQAKQAKQAEQKKLKQAEPKQQTAQSK